MPMRQLNTEYSNCRHDNKLRIPSPETSKPTFKDAKRIQESITSGIERKALLWLAARVPSFINSDHLTLLGFVAMFLAGASYALARWYPIGLLLATFFLAVNWLGDSLDGTLARVRNCQRPRYGGFYVDHMIDLVWVGVSYDWPRAVNLCRLANRDSYVDCVPSFSPSKRTWQPIRSGVFRLSFAMFGPTEIRIFSRWVTLDCGFIPTRLCQWGLACAFLDFGGLLAACGMTTMAMVATIWHTRELYRQETKR